MPQLKVAIQLKSLRQPLKRALPLAAQLGASAVELDARTELRPEELTPSAVRQLRKLLDDYNLRVSAISYPTRRGYDVAADLERRVEGTKAAMRMAYALGATCVVNHVGRIPDLPEGAKWTLMTEALADLGRFGQHVGALFAARTGAESGDRLAQLIAAVPAGLIGVDFDPGALIVNGFSALEAIPPLGSHILHVHATDAVHDLARGRGLEVELGRGTADYPALLGALEDVSYRGYFTIQRETAADPVHEIAQAVKYLRSL